MAGFGPTGTLLAERMQARSRVGLTMTRAGAWTVIVAAAAEQLPWTEGCLLLAPLPDAAELLAPVHVLPDVPAAVLLAAVRRLAAPSPAPYALLPGAGPDGDQVTVVALHAEPG